MTPCRGAGATRRAAVMAASLLLPVLLGAGPLTGQAARAPGQAPGGGTGPAVVPGVELTISVMTMGVGAAVWERFGHNAIVVTDRRRGTSTAYNYGMFSFRQENFLLRFLQGRMLYWMAGYPTENVIPVYAAAGRSVWEQELNLTPTERLAVRDFLEWNALEENRFYRYDYYLDNCSTRVRDVIDRVLGGAFRTQMQGPASGSYRFHTQRLNSHNPALYTGLMLALGEGADQPVSKWDEMFLPLKLRDYLREVRVPDSSGTLVPLVRAERTIFESHEHPVLEVPPRWMLAYLFAGLVLGACFYWGGLPGSGTGWGWRIARGGGTTWAIVTGLAGVVLLGLWMLTDHAIAARNENLLQLSVVALVVGGLLVAERPGRPRVRQGLRLLAYVVGGLSLLGLLIKLLPFFDQVNGQVLALTLPANLGLTLGILRRTRGS